MGGRSWVVPVLWPCIVLGGVEGGEIVPCGIPYPFPSPRVAYLPAPFLTLLLIYILPSFFASPPLSPSHSFTFFISSPNPFFTLSLLYILHFFFQFFLHPRTPFHFFISFLHPSLTLLTPFYLLLFSSLLFSLPYSSFPIITPSLVFLTLFSIFPSFLHFLARWCSSHVLPSLSLSLPFYTYNSHTHSFIISLLTSLFVPSSPPFFPLRLSLPPLFCLQLPRSQILSILISPSFLTSSFSP